MAVNKLMIIIWRWRHFSKNELKYRHEPVEGDLDRIISIHEEWLDENVNQQIEQFCNQELSKYPEVFIFCHNPDVKRKKNVLYLLNQCKNYSNVSLFYFGDGKGYIYFSKEDETGLLDHSGGFQNDHRRGVGFRTVLLEDGRTIKKLIFHNVWNHYALNKYKEPIYTYLREKLLLEMFGEVFDSPIRSWLELQPDDAKSKINEFILGDHPVFREKESLLNERHDLLQARQDLIQLIDKPSPTAMEVRSVTEVLLKNIAGPIY